MRTYNGEEREDDNFNARWETEAARAKKRCKTTEDYQEGTSKMSGSDSGSDSDSGS